MAEKKRYGCVMLVPEISGWNRQLSIIDDNDVIPHPHKDNAAGKESEPHVTALYGLHDEINASHCKDVLKWLITKPFEIKLIGIDCFENENFDVVIFKIESDLLMDANKLLQQFPFTTDHPDYKPHMTIAYVKKGEGKKYVKELGEPVKLTMNQIVFSDSSRNKVTWDIPNFSLPTFSEFTSRD